VPESEQSKKLLSVDNLRHAEYYEMQGVFDDLYARSRKGETFSSLMDLILSRENILLAYRNIKTNGGSMTSGVDGLTIKDIGRLSSDEVVGKVRYIVAGSKLGYRPKPVKRKEIPKPNGKTRPLGIPCIWDRLIQQCIKQIMEPVCEARFCDSSYGFRPNCSVENAISNAYLMLNRVHLYYVIEFDIKGFFDNIDHTKLVRQLWAIGIRDKHLIYVLKQILKAPIKMPNGALEYPTKGTPQGGIISPLLANVVLNELDHWIESQWKENPVVRKYSVHTNQNGIEIRSNGYKGMRKTTALKEMQIVRYADDFRIFCPTKTVATKTMHAVTQWLKERLRLDVSPEKTRIVNAKRKYAEFLGFKFKVHPRGQKMVVQSHICDKQKQREHDKLVEQAKRIAHPREGKERRQEVSLYNQMVSGIQNYYQIATDIAADCADFQWAIDKILRVRLGTAKSYHLTKKGRKLTAKEKARYGGAAKLKFVAGLGEPIYPIGWVQHRNPMGRNRKICCYTPEGRKGLHDNLRINTALMHRMMREALYGRSAEYADNRISLFSAQWGKCAVSGREFDLAEEIHCHHIIPLTMGGDDSYANLMLVCEPVHILIHAMSEKTIRKYLSMLQLTKAQMAKLNKLRQSAGLEPIQ